ncbi:SMI1/KNR4 family protein [Streptomyces sp. NPDC052052]|uniref:SMI1/KNR4 family protein n=1 Tax=Streptomyces sp. NPDC052052 TaxID=3154756 RepID=UPI0034182EF7
MSKRKFRKAGREEGEALGDLLSLNHEAGDEVDWGEMRRSWGTEFPSDYKWFMSVYGVGCISDWIAIARPGSPQCDDSGSMGQETANARFVWDMKREPERSGIVKLPVIAWGVTPGAAVLCWLTTDEDPDEWGVVVMADDASITVYECGMTEFLRGLFLGDPDQRSFDEGGFWGGGVQVFLHWREEERLLRAGTNPWTGLPDEYVDLEFDGFS